MCWIEFFVPFWRYLHEGMEMGQNLIGSLFLGLTSVKPNFELPSGYVKIAIENGPVEIVDFPINSMVMFNSYVKLPNGKTTIFLWVFL